MVISERIKKAWQALRGKQEPAATEAAPMVSEDDVIVVDSRENTGDYTAPMVRRARNTLERRRQENGF